MIGGVSIAQKSVADAPSQVADSQSALKTASGSIELPALPPVPRGESTIIGGEIQNIDLVRDELTLRVYGQRPMKILFDERTQVYLDGKKIPLHDLGSGDHASVQTVLDGTSVFALSIHMLSRLPRKRLQGDGAELQLQQKRADRQAGHIS